MDTSYSQTIHDILKNIIHPITGKDTFEMNIEKEGDQWRIDVNCDNSERLIGENGETLKAIQHVLRVLVHLKYPEDRTHFLLDIGRFRLQREQILKDKARDIAETEVLNLGTTLIFVGLTSYERKIIHNLLNEIDGLETTSVGQGNSRKLLIRPTSELGSKGMESAKVIDLFDSIKTSLDSEGAEK